MTRPSPLFTATLSVLSRTPDVNELDVTAKSDIVVKFSADINGATFGGNIFNVYGSLSGKISGTCSTAADTVTFNPATDFKPGEMITVTLTTGIQDADDNTLAAPVTWQFTVATASGPGIFNAELRSLSSGGGTLSMVPGDFDGDGDLDILATNDGKSVNFIFLNKGNGAFAEAKAIGYEAHPKAAMAAADLDNDGDLDIIEINDRTQSCIYLNNGSGGFDTDVSFGINPADETNSVAVGDVDSDGDLDMVVGAWNAKSYVYYNNGSARFSASAEISDSTSTVAVALGDVDNDGDLDIISTKKNAQNKIHLNNGNGTFDTAGRNFGPAAAWTSSAALGDVNGDSYLDIVTGNNGGQDAVYINDGSGNFGKANNYGPAVNTTYQVALADMDGDGDLDILTANGRGQGKIYCNDGDGTFDTASLNIGPDNNLIRTVAAGDFDGEGDLDITIGGLSNCVYFNANREINLKQDGANIANGGAYNFGAHYVGSSTDVVFTIENTGTENLSLTMTRSFTGANADQFSIVTQPSSTVAASGSTTFTVRFSPTVSGAKTAEISIANNDGNENPYYLTLNGMGINPEIGVTCNGIAINTGNTTASAADYTDFGIVDNPGIPVTRTFTITNSGTGNLNLTGNPVVNITGHDASDFTVTSLPQIVIAAGNGTTFQVTFTPSSPGSKTAVINIANNDINENPYSFAIQGTFITYSDSGTVNTDTGKGTEDDPYLIEDVNDWKSLMGSPKNWSACFKLTADIDLDGVALTPVGNASRGFDGRFDGNYHTISNARLVDPAGNYYGLFGWIKPGGKIVRLGIKNITVNAHQQIGGLVGSNYGTITDCYTSGSVTCSDSAGGGLVGYSWDGAISRCFSTCTVTGPGSIGGLVGGSFRGTVDNCYAAGAVSSTTQGGGFTGRTTNTKITDCYAIGPVTGAGARGFTGADGEDGEFIGCYWDTMTTGQNASGEGEGRTTAEMTYPYDTSLNTTYSGWNFNTVWVHDTKGNNGGYPYLTWQKFP